MMRKNDHVAKQKAILGVLHFRLSVSFLLLITLSLSMLFLNRAQAFSLGDELKKMAGDAVKAKLSPADAEADEVAIGRQIAGNLLGAAPLVKDEKLQKYVNQVGRWVAEQGDRPDLSWHFGVIESSDINAFATPGGYIFITKGLYQKLNDESELAGVLAHEIAHVIRKHHLRVLQKSKLIDAGGKLMSRETGENSKISQVIGSGAEVAARALDKNAEFDADRIAVVLATRAGYDAYGLPSVLQEIGHQGSSDSVALLFKTHPHPDERLAKLEGVMETYLEKLKGQSLASRFYRLK